jgi:DNA (cytosine-5)-methyltransferase 1
MHFFLKKCTDLLMDAFYKMHVVMLFFCRPFGRLWGDETVSTVVTRAEPHNQVNFL